ncbi:MAG: hypothetical protein L6R39_004151 [Caloplaca ligustica]|nr:MAG: hypothetical protein L6R39_004151 [Caloplaca ligustica]
MTSRREGLQPHIPKLAYRNSPSTVSVSDRSISTVRTNSSTASISTCASSPPTSSFGGSPRSFHFTDAPLSPLSLDGGSDTAPTSAFLSPRAAKGPKKKSSPFFGFLSVKEPSTQAFEAYQEQMKKRGTTQSGRANAVGLPGVSSAKLPPTVPKVNSRWDGVPQTLKEKEKEKAKKHDSVDRQSLCSAASRPLHTSRSAGSNMTSITTGSTSSTSSKSSTGSAPRVNGKLKFDHDNGNLSDMYGWETVPQSNQSSTRSLPLEPRESATSASRPCHDGPISYFPQPTAVSGSTCDLPIDIPPPLDPPSNRSSPTVLPALPSPATPNGSFCALPLSPRAGYPTNSAPAKEPWGANNEGVVLTSSGVNVLGPPVTATYKSEANRPHATGGNKGAGTPLGSSIDRRSTHPSSILKRPDITSNEIWPVPPPPADHRDNERAVTTPVTMHGNKSRFLSIFGKGA